MSHLQPLHNTQFIPTTLHKTLNFIYSHHVHNQSTINNKITTHQKKSILLPILLTLNTKLIFNNNKTLSIKNYLTYPYNHLLTKIIIKNPYHTYTTHKINHSQTNLTIITTTITITNHNNIQITLNNITNKTLHLHNIKKQNLKNNTLKQTITNTIFPQKNLQNNITYKHYITKVLITNLYTNYQQTKKKTI